VVNFPQDIWYDNETVPFILIIDKLRSLKDDYATLFDPEITITKSEKLKDNNLYHQNVWFDTRSFAVYGEENTCAVNFLVVNDETLEIFKRLDDEKAAAWAKMMEE
jgi:hypothetical protein